jgi:flagellar hook-length control protein FliK
LRIELTVQHGALSARLEAETPAARNLLLDNLPALRDRLAQQDIRVERFDVDVRRDGGGSNQQGTQDRPTGDPGWRGDQQRREPAAPRTPEPPRGPRTPAARTAAADARLDVRV